MLEWQYTNQFFEEGRIHYAKGGSINDCPYDYLDVDQSDEKLVQTTNYMMNEWICGFKCAHNLYTSSLNQKLA